ncbi:hypothetical protein CKW39_09025 [Kocuria sp. WRN011]|uniref:hypothetical protein n=1 Tax=Kocuria sp. WRN011 TaxID=2029858 RepID=UPI000BAECB8F|nr:hypothetical protein [Kocuria sp. WRN011]PBB08492.1 hypothetical protein CKW39_09025 [Kocuria sp. WRN011]
MGFWEWAGSSDATTVLTAVFGTGGLGGVVMLVIRHVLKDKPPKSEQVEAVETVAAPAPDRDALWIARQALAISDSDRGSLRTLQDQMKELGAKFEHVTRINTIQGEWILDIRGRWHIVRLSEDPPPPPDITNI